MYIQLQYKNFIKINNPFITPYMSKAFQKKRQICAKNNTRMWRLVKNNRECKVNEDHIEVCGEAELQSQFVITPNQRTAFRFLADSTVRYTLQPSRFSSPVKLKDLETQKSSINMAKGELLEVWFFENKKVSLVCSNGVILVPETKVNLSKFNICFHLDIHGGSIMYLGFDNLSIKQ